MGLPGQHPLDDHSKHRTKFVPTNIPANRRCVGLYPHRKPPKVMVCSPRRAMTISRHKAARLRKMPAIASRVSRECRRTIVHLTKPSIKPKRLITIPRGTHQKKPPPRMARKMVTKPRPRRAGDAFAVAMLFSFFPKARNRGLLGAFTRPPRWLSHSRYEPVLRRHVGQR